MSNPDLPQASPSHNAYTDSYSALCSPSSVSDSANSSLSWDMDATVNASEGRPNSSSASHEVQELVATPHDKFFYTNGMIDIRIGTVLFRVPRLGLASYSKSFEALMRTYDDRVRMHQLDSVEPLCIQEEDVTSVDFERLLEIIYPSIYGKVGLETQDEWLSVLHLETKWSFDGLRNLSISQLDSLPITSAIDKLLIGRKYEVSHWISEAYLVLCQRNEALTLEECRRLSLDDVVKINEVRQSIRVYKSMRPFTEIRSTVDKVLRFPAPVVSKPESNTAAVPQSTNASSNPGSTRTTSLKDSVRAKPPTLEPADVPRISRLIKAYTQKPSNITKSGFEKLIQPYVDEADVMDAVVQSITALLRDDTIKLDQSKNLTQIGQILLDSIDPSCGDSDEDAGQQPTTGSHWLAQRMMKHCYANFSDWQASRAETLKRTTGFLAWLNKTGCTTQDVFEPCWQEMNRQAEKPYEQWISSIYALFLQNNSDIQTSHHALHIDQFFTRVETVCNQNTYEQCYFVRNGYQAGYCLSQPNSTCNICKLRKIQEMRL